MGVWGGDGFEEGDKDGVEIEGVEGRLGLSFLENIQQRGE